MPRLLLTIALAAFTMVATTIARAQTPAESSTEQKEKFGPPSAANSVWLTGTIRYVSLEGGFYGIVADNGQRYDPIALNPKFAHDGMRVKVQARLLTSALTLRMWGVPIKIIEIDIDRGASESTDSDEDE